MYAIAELIHEKLAERGWRKSTLVQAMGYAQISRGMKRLEACLQTGDCSNRDWMRRLGEALEITPRHLDFVIRETEAQVAQERAIARAREEARLRDSFRPYIYVLTSETRPSSITAAAVIGPRLKRIELDETALALPTAEQIAYVGTLVRQHYRENLGKCLLYGEITGYRFHLGYQDAVDYNATGVILARHTGRIPEEPRVTLTVGHKEITDGLFAYLG